MNPAVYYFLIVLLFLAIQQIRRMVKGDPVEALEREKLYSSLLEQEIAGLKMDNEVLREYIQEMQEATDVTLKYQLN